MPLLHGEVAELPDRRARARRRALRRGRLRLPPLAIVLATLVLWIAALSLFGCLHYG